jgi:hypothetical protein
MLIQRQNRNQRNVYFKESFVATYTDGTNPARSLYGRHLPSDGSCSLTEQPGSAPRFAIAKKKTPKRVTHRHILGLVKEWAKDGGHRGAVGSYHDQLAPPSSWVWASSP